MKIAFISDIHANLPALKAVLADIDEQQVDNVYCLGDLVNFAGWDNETIELIRQRNIPCIQGNHDAGIGAGKEVFPYSYKGDAQKEFGVLSIKRVNRVITSKNRAYLAALPFMTRLQFRFSTQPIQLAIVHGSTVSNEEYILEDWPEQDLREQMENVGADILLMGHTHIPYHKLLCMKEKGKKIYRHAINVGSVGKPKHGNLDACYCLLSLRPDMDLSLQDSLSVNFRYIQYDIGEVKDKIRGIGLPGAYEGYLSGAK